MIPAAMIFCAGFGKRLHPLTHTTPKPLLPVGGVSCLERSIAALLDLGVQKIIINTHHLSNAFQPIIAQYQNHIIHIHEDEILETGGGLKNALPYLGDSILCLNGDVWFENYDFLTTFVENFDPQVSDVQLLCVAFQNIIFGAFSGDYIQNNTPHLVYKTRSPHPPNCVYAGVQMIKKQAFSAFADPLKHFSLKQFYDASEAMHKLNGFTYSGKWCDIGTLTVYNALNSYLKEHS